MGYSRLIILSALAALAQLAPSGDAQCTSFAALPCTVTEECRVSGKDTSGICLWGGPGVGVQCTQFNIPPNGPTCGAERDNCSCFLGMCLNSARTDTCAPDVARDCAVGDFICGDPHMVGLAGQNIDWSGEDGAWYSLLKDHAAQLSINVRLTAPLPADFPERQLITGVSVISQGNSIVVENTDPYHVDPVGCPEGLETPCLSNGGLTITVNGRNAPELLVPTQRVQVEEGLTVSSANLPVECRQFGGDRAWTLIFEEMSAGRRHLNEETFEEWVLRFDQVAAPEWCAKYITERGLTEVQSVHSIFRIETPLIAVRLNAGVNQQSQGEVDAHGRELPDLEFWQMDVGFEGLDSSRFMTGVLGETARPVKDMWGKDVMEGAAAMRGAVADYKVSGPLGVNFIMDEGSQ